MSLLKKSRIKLLLRLLVVLLFLICLGVFAPLIMHFGHALSPESKAAENGEVFLYPSDFEQNNKVALDDGWRFFEGQLLLPQEVDSVINQARFVRGKGGWQLTANDSNQVNGFGTYHLTVHMPAENPQLAVKIPQIGSAYRLFINHKLVAKGGEVSASISKAKPGYNAQIVMLPNEQAKLTLTIQVSSYHTGWGGLWSPIVLGNANDIFGTQSDLVALSMFILGVLAITAAFYLIQFYLRPSEKIPLIFAFLCLLLFARELSNEHMLFVLQFLRGSFAAGVKMDYLTFYLLVPAVLYFMQLCFPQIFKVTITKVFYLISGAFSVFVLLSPTQYISYSLTSYQIFCLVVMLYILYCLILSRLRKLPAANMMLLGSLILSVFAVNDILYEMDLVATGHFFSLGIVGFIICQSYVINTYFDDVRSRNEALSGQLQQRNLELQQFGAELENKVEQRTQELEKANAELQKFADFDQLTGALNRHGMQTYLQTAFERLRRSNAPSSIVLFDFDHFKNINDTYGHDKGDKILKSAVDLVKGLMREQDKIARWGGEEFLVLLPDTEISGALAIAEKWRLAIQAQLSNTLAPEEPVTVTAGVAQFSHNEIFEILFKRADNALYKGKRMGRNCVQS